MYTWRNARSILNVRELENVRETTGYAIQSQYSASGRILALAESYQKHIDPHVDVELFFDKMFNIYTAEGAGLDNWGLILQMGRDIPDPDSAEVITLDDDYFRLLLLYKAMANISASTAEAQNSLLAMLIDTGIGQFPKRAYVLEVGAMHIRWVFEDFLDSMQRAVFRAAGILTKGAGVGWQMYAINVEQVFGFDGSGMHPFNQRPFAPDNALLVGE